MTALRSSASKVNSSGLLKFRIPISYRFVLMLIAIAIVTHWRWFMPGFQSRWGDSAGVPAAAYHQFSYSWLGWLSLTDLGGVNIQPYMLMFFQTWRITNGVGMNFATAEQITMLWPIAILSFLSPFLFIRRLFASDLGAFAGALVYGLSTSLLMLEGYEVFLALGFSLLPLILYATDRVLEYRSWRSLFFLVLVFNLLCYVEIRVAFLSFLLVILYLCFALRAEDRRLPSILKIAVGIAVTILLSAFWIVVVVQSASSSIATTTSRTIFGNNYTNFTHAITLTSGGWVNGALVVFVLGPVPLIMWIMPILALLGAVSKGSGRVLQRGAVTLFGGMLAFGSVMLAKQVNPPIASLYSWLYYDFPGFSLFRVGTDFFVTASLGYAILIAKFYSPGNWSRVNLKRMSYKVLYPLALVALLATIIVPLVDGKVGALFVYRSKPLGLARVTSVIQGQNDFSRSLWLPGVPTWSSYSLSHPAISAVDLLNPGQPLQHYVVPFGPQSIGEAIVQELGSPRGLQMLQRYSVKYIVLPPAGNANTGPDYSYYGEPRSFYSNWLGSTPWLKQISGAMGGYSVYRLIHPMMYGPNNTRLSSFQQQFHVVNPDLLVNVLRLSTLHKTVVPVSMKYNSNWKAYVVPLRDLSSVCRVSTKRITSCNTGSGLGILFNLWSWGLHATSGVKGPLDQLEFRIVSSGRLGSGADPVAVVMVFGSALEDWILLYLAEVGFVVICSLLLAYRLIPVIRRFL